MNERLEGKLAKVVQAVLRLGRIDEARETFAGGHTADGAPCGWRVKPDPLRPVQVKPRCTYPPAFINIQNCLDNAMHCE